MSYANLVMLSASIPVYRKKGEGKEVDLGEIDSKDDFNKLFGIN